MPWTRDRKRHLRIGLILLVPVLLAVAAYLARDPLMEYARGWRSAHNLKEAREALEDETKWEKAYEHALVARQLNPDSIEALRVLTESSFQTQSVRTLDYANDFFLHPDATETDKLRVLNILQRAQDYVGFVRLYNLLPEESRRQREFVLVRARFLIDRNAYAAAQSLLEQEIEEDRDRRYLLMLASLLVRTSATPEEIARGQRLIEELSANERSDEIARTAFELLGFVDPDRVDPALLGNLGARAELTEKRSPAEYLAAANLAIAAAENPEARRRIVERAIREQSDIAPSRLAAWLQRIGNDEDILELLTEKRSRGDPVLYRQRFAALLRKGRLEEADQWLEDPPAGIEAIHIWLARAQLAQAKETKAEENNAWEQAFQVAEMTADRNEYLRIFDVASRADRVDLAARALLKAPQHPNGILTYLVKNERIEDLRYLTEAFVAREPDNIVLLNNLVYLNLLLGDQVEHSMQTIPDLIEKRPDLLSLRTTHAFGLLLQDQDAKALEALPDSPTAWRRATSADHAIHALALERNGLAERAREAWNRVDREDLTEAEEEIFFPPLPGEERGGGNTRIANPARPSSASNPPGAEPPGASR